MVQDRENLKSIGAIAIKLKWPWKVKLRHITSVLAFHGHQMSSVIASIEYLDRDFDEKRYPWLENFLVYRWEWRVLVYFLGMLSGSWSKAHCRYQCTKCNKWQSWDQDNQDDALPVVGPSRPTPTRVSINKAELVQDITISWYAYMRCRL